MKTVELDLKKIREVNGLTQEGLAKLLEMQRNSIYFMERNGRITRRTLRVLEALNLVKVTRRKEIIEETIDIIGG